ncbi:MAG: hypothetical protein WCO09_00280 [bacterium]
MKIRIATVNDWKHIKSLYLSLLKNDPDAFADECEIVSALTDQDWINKLSKDIEETLSLHTQTQNSGRSRARCGLGLV